jgi:ectoine hydroxylase-related dioxygenase (phytanoyl-CoA dioxygenase family)
VNTQLPSLSSNGLPISTRPERFGMLREAPARANWRAQYLQDGYLVLRNVLDADTVLTAREAYLSSFDASMCEHGDARRGVFSGHLPEALPIHGVAGHPAHSFVRSSTFTAIADQPVFADIARTLLEADVVRVPRTPLRHFIKGTHRASRAHTDRTYLDEPVESCVTLWLPLGDCPIEAGSLMYLEGSHLIDDVESRLRDQAPTDRADDSRPISHDLNWVATRAQSRWLTANFKAGDLVAHTPTIVHASLDPAIDLMRVSTDLRFLRAGAPLDTRWQDHWAADDGH